MAVDRGSALMEYLMESIVSMVSMADKVSVYNSVE